LNISNIVLLYSGYIYNVNYYPNIKNDFLMFSRLTILQKSLLELGCIYNRPKIPYHVSKAPSIGIICAH